MEKEKDYDLSLFIKIIGSPGVGKTSILERYCKGTFTEKPFSKTDLYIQTKFFEFDSKKVKVNYKDTDGVEKYIDFSENLVRGADGFILVYDITKQKTFDSLNRYFDYIREKFSNLPKILIGNKLDLEEERVVRREEAQALADSNGFNYFEGSAKSGFNINEALDEIARITYLDNKDIKVMKIQSSGTHHSSHSYKNKSCLIF